MGSPKITEQDPEGVGDTSKVKRLGMNETFVTDENGFEHLKLLKGRLESLTLRQSLVHPTAIKQLNADHPNSEVITSTPAEVAESRFAGISC